MKTRKPKTALSNRFLRAETLSQYWKNLTRPQKASIAQKILLFAFCGFLCITIFSGNTPCLVGAAGTIIGAIILEGYR